MKERRMSFLNHPVQESRVLLARGIWRVDLSLDKFLEGKYRFHLLSFHLPALHSPTACSRKAPRSGSRNNRFRNAQIRIDLNLFFSSAHICVHMNINPFI